MAPPDGTKPDVPNNGYDTPNQPDWFDYLTSNEAGIPKGLIDAFKAGEKGLFADNVREIVSDLYKYGGNEAIERVAPFIEDAAKHSDGIFGYLRKGAQGLNKLDDFKVLKGFKGGVPVVDVVVGTLSVINDYRNGDNWVSEAFKQGASIAAGVGASALAAAGVVAAGITAPAWATALGVALVGAAASYGVASAWDFVESNWDNITEWTGEKLTQAKEAFQDFVEGASDWMSEKATEFSDWVGDKAGEFSDWIDKKADQVSEMYDYVKDKAGEFGQDVVDFWEDAKDAAGEAVTDAKEWLSDKWSDISETGQEMWDTAKDWVGDQVDRIKDKFDDAKSAAEDWLGDKAKDLKDFMDDVRDDAKDLWDDFKDWWNDDDEDSSDEAEDADDRSKTARTEASPLVLDLDGDGIELNSINGAGAVYWDVDVDGFRERSGWVSPDDGLLAIDNNNNGIIDDHSELFGTLSIDGFSILAALDSNSDGKISDADDNFDDLLVWRDLDQNGRTDAGELSSLDFAGVAEISLSASLVTETIAGNSVTHRSTYKGTDGKSYAVVDAWFTYDNLNTRYGGDVPFDSLAQDLPQVRGYGTIADLRTAMSLDESLRDMILEIANQPAELVFDPDFDLEGKLREAMFRWAGVQDVDPNGRGGYVNGQELAFIEAFTDRPFLQYGRPNPAPEASRTLTNAFDTIFNTTLLKILLQTIGDSFFKDRPAYQWESDDYSDPFTLNMQSIEDLAEIYAGYATDMKAVWVGFVRMIDTAIGIDNLGVKQRQRLEDAATDNGGVSIEAALQVIYPPVGLGLNGTAGDDNLRGGGGRDSLSTSGGNDKLFGLRGDDNLNAGPGNDTLTGGSGNDLAQGGTGNDTYIYQSGFETYVDTSGNDTLILRGGIVPADLAYLISPANEDDLEIYAGGELIIRIEGYFNGTGAIEKIEFAKTGQKFDLLTLAQGTVGTTGNDTIEGDQNASFPSDRIDGLEGNDLIIGKSGSDVLIGNLGRDTLKGGSGSDVLLGEEGNDRLEGGAAADNMQGGVGNDFYITEGNDVIFDEGGNDTVVLRKGIGFNQVTLARVAYSDDLIIQTPRETIQVLDHFKSPDNAIETLQRIRDNGTKVNVAIGDLTIEQFGTESYDRMRGDLNGAAAADILRGLAGSDYIYGYLGDDILDGGLGDDRSYGGSGGDRYLVGLGHDFVQDYTTIDGDAPDTVEVLGIRKSQASLSRMLDGDIMVTFKNGSVQIDRAFDEAYAVERIEFEKGGSINVANLKLTTKGTAGNDAIYGNREELGSREDNLIGLDGDDRIYGYDGKDRLEAGKGNDQLFGATENDTYVVGKGHDYVSDVGNDTDTADTLRLKGVKSGDAEMVRRSDGDLLINWGTGSVLIDRAFDISYAVERLVFDNKTINIADVVMLTMGTNGSETLYGNREELGSRNDRIIGLDGDDRLYGYDGNDTLDAGMGDDTSYGAEGADRYIAGEGDDFIQDYASADGTDGDDVIRLKGVKQADATIVRLSDGDLFVHWSNGSVRIDRAFDLRYHVEKLIFDNATVDLTTLSVRTVGTGGNDVLNGNNEETGGRNDRLEGLDGNDTIRGYDGQDTLVGGAGNDSKYGGEQADRYIVGEGEDFVQDLGAADLMDGNDIVVVNGVRSGAANIMRLSDGDLLIDWGYGSVRIDRAFDARYHVERLKFDNTTINLSTYAATTVGTNGNDNLRGNQEEKGSRDDRIEGRAGNDRLEGYDGNDTLLGGSGDDSMYGGTQADLYVVGPGNDFIQDAGSSDGSDGPDTVRVRGVDRADAEIIRLSDGDLFVLWNGGSVRIDAAFDIRYGIENLVFDDRTIDVTSLKPVTIGDEADNSLRGNQQENGSRDDRIEGRAGDDDLYGYDGNDTLIGGNGDDDYYGAEGADRYVVGKGDDYISDVGASDLSDGDDVVRVLGVNRSDASFQRLSDGDLFVSWMGGSVRIDAAFDARYHIEQLIFDDSTVTVDNLWPVTIGTAASERLNGNTQEKGGRNDRIEGKDGDDRLYGYDGNDTLVGGAGDDSMYGDIGANRYVVGEGHDFIQDYGNADNTDGNDLIRILGVDRFDASITRLLNDDIKVDWGTGSVVIDNALDARYHVEQLQFDDRTINLTDVPLRTVGTARGENLFGNQEENGTRNDRMEGEGGDDVLRGYDGDDTLIGGEGDDDYYGGEGANRYVVGEGHDYIQDYGNADNTDGDDVVRVLGVNRADASIVRLADGDLYVSWADGSVRIDRAFDQRYHVETLIFDDQSVDVSAISPRTVGTTAGEALNGNTEETGGRNDRIEGRAGNDVLSGQDGNDTLIGGSGSDTMYGGTGNDTYDTGAGDVVGEGSSLADGTDLILLPFGMTSTNFTTEQRDTYDLAFVWAGGELVIDNYFRGPGYIIENAMFRAGPTNGQTVALSSLVGTPTVVPVRTNKFGDALDNNIVADPQGSSIYTREGNDTSTGGAGDDWHYGTTGGDLYNVGQGHDFVQDVSAADGTDPADTVRVNGVNRADADLSVDKEGDLWVTWAGGSVEIDQAFNARYHIERLVFDDRTVTVANLAPEIRGTNASETLFGNRQDFGGRNDRIVAEDGDDRLYGYDGNDTLTGGAGDDQYYGSEGADTYRVGQGDDYVQDAAATDGMDGDDVIRVLGVNRADAEFYRLNDGDLWVKWTGGSVRVDNAFDIRYHVETLVFDDATIDVSGLSPKTLGTAGGETLYGNREDFGGRNDRIEGLEGNDALYGYDGPDTLVGGEGDDSSYGETGADTYVVGKGDDFVRDAGAADGTDGNDKIRVEGVNRGDADIVRLIDGDLLVSWDGGSVRIDQAFDQRYHIERLIFDDRTINLSTLEATTMGSGSNETLRGNSEETGGRNDRILGKEGNDRLDGYDGNDTLEGGAGNDSSYGGIGGDVYRVGPGDDYVSDVGEVGGAADRVRILGVNRNEATMTRRPDGDVLISWAFGSVLIDAMFDERYAIEQIVFDDATIDTLNLALPTIGTGASETISGNNEERGSRNDEIRGEAGNDRLNGLEGNDTLNGGSGNDSAYGSVGADTYIVGQGHDFVSDNGDAADGVDRVVLDGLNRADVNMLRRTDGDLEIFWANGSVRIDQVFDEDYAIERLVFDDRTINPANLSLMTEGTDGNEAVYGNTQELGRRTDYLKGLDGNDSLYGYDGKDTLDGGNGNDEHYGADGADTYIASLGNDFIRDVGNASDGNDRILFNGLDQSDVMMSLLPGGDALFQWGNGPRPNTLVVDAFFDEAYAIERLVFDDGVVDTAMLGLTKYGTGGAETLLGNREERGSRDDVINGLDGNDRLFGYEGNDTLIGGAGNDSSYGAEGADRYFVGLGDDFVSDAAGTGDGPDTVRIEGVTRGQADFVRLLDGDLLISWNDGSVRIDAAFDERYNIENLRFDGATVRTANLEVRTVGTGGSETINGNTQELGSRNDDLRGLDGNDRLYGFDGNDSLRGGDGDDSLYGATGDDIYFVSAGSDVIYDGNSSSMNDTLVLPGSLSVDDLTFERVSNRDLRISWDDAEVLIQYQFFGDAYAVENLRFGNGPVMDLDFV